VCWPPHNSISSLPHPLIRSSHRLNMKAGYYDCKRFLSNRDKQLGEKQKPEHTWEVLLLCRKYCVLPTLSFWTALEWIDDTFSVIRHTTQRRGSSNTWERRLQRKDIHNEIESTLNSDNICCTSVKNFYLLFIT
jgi:hypothetical protein